MKDMYDPMTGELLQQPEEEMNFDPMTGQPIYNGTSSPVPEKKGKKLPIIAGVIGGIIVVAAIIIVVLLILKGCSKNEKPKAPIEPTFNYEKTLLEAGKKYYENNID